MVITNLKDSVGTLQQTFILKLYSYKFFDSRSLRLIKTAIVTSSVYSEFSNIIISKLHNFGPQGLETTANHSKSSLKSVDFN